MSVLLITYDLSKEFTRPNITKRLKDAYPNWAKLSESSYAISTSSSPSEVHSHLKPMLDTNDTIYIITLKKPWTGFGPKDVNEWIEKNLTY